jgi:hypothetical protein
MIPRLVNFRLSRYNNEKKILFVRSSLAGWLIGKIFSWIFFHEIVGIHSDHNDLGTKELFWILRSIK